jgi:protein TonB
MAVEIWSPQERTHSIAEAPPPLPRSPDPTPVPVDAVIVDPLPEPVFASVDELDAPDIEPPEFGRVTPDAPDAIAAPTPPPALEFPVAEVEPPSLELDLSTDPVSETLGPPPLAGELNAPPAGPARAERRREIEAASKSRERDVTSRIARVRGARERVAAPIPPPAPPRDTADGPVAAQEGVEGPLGKRRLIYRESPPYPEWARRQGLETDVKFRIWVNPGGTVSRVSITKRSGNTELDALAERALKQWRFEPLPAHVPQRDEWGEVPMAFRLVRAER